MLRYGADMGTPQDSSARRRERRRRARKNSQWDYNRARENAEAQKPKAPRRPQLDLWRQARRGLLLAMRTHGPPLHFRVRTCPRGWAFEV